MVKSSHIMEKLKNSLQDRVNPRMLKSEPIQRCVLAQCNGACCIFGVWVDIKEAEDILANASLIAPHLPAESQDPAEWFAPVQDKDEQSPSGIVVHTAVDTRPQHYGGTACIFCLDGGKCALQVAANAAGLHPWRFKPFYCILHPLDMDDEGRITLDETTVLLNEEGSCLIPADHLIPLVETFAPELRYLLGSKGYKALLQAAQKQDFE